ncbi:MAG TPA: glycosyl hydrolase family 79 C-terminal domain-containing protein [Ktedonobacterales bacterium]|nr:glycosyl hydrolase family 79 C-terminal domain-containing protein [Ktedonobacterales bacterium]
MITFHIGHLGNPRLLERYTSEIKGLLTGELVSSIFIGSEGLVASAWFPTSDRKGDPMDGRRMISVLQRHSAKALQSLVIFLLLPLLASSCLPDRRVTPTPNLPGDLSSTQTLFQNSNALVSVGAQGNPIPASFLGFSVEVSSLCQIIQLDTAKRAYYEQLYRNFGAGVLHVGGHTGDISQWVPNGTASCSQQNPIITKTLVQAVFAFAHRIQWKVTWGISLIANDPAMAASEAAYVASVGGKDLTAFTIGNEPELYIKQGYRPATWSYSDYYTEWKRTRDAILAAVPSAEFIGPEVCCDSTIFSSFIQGSRGDGSLLAISRHYYTRASEGPKPTVNGLLSAQGMAKFASSEAGWVKFANSYHLPFELTETNSIAGGGFAGVTNTLAASLWLSDVLLQSATAGVTQIDVQNAPNAAYNVIGDDGRPTVLYYALLLAHIATTRARVVQAALQTALNLTAYAFSDSLGTLRVVLINKETTQPALVTINTAHLYLSAHLFRLSGPNLSATSGVTLGDRTVSAQGTWAPPSTSSPIQGTLTQISVPAGSALCVTFQA